MIVSAALLFVSLIGVVISLSWTGASDFLLLAGPCAIASCILLFRESRAWVSRHAGPAPETAVIDGSNVMYWQGGVPMIETVRDVVQDIRTRGFLVHVVFDANAGYLFADGFRGEKAISRLLGLTVDQVTVVDSGTPADPHILQMAREADGVVISNDRYRDWTSEFPEVNTPGHLVNGDFRNGRLWFDFTTKAAAA